MIHIRRSLERGHANHGWLDSYHTFSFAGYYDPRFMGFRTLRVINEDQIEGGQGFGTHPHKDMEIITYMVEGDLAHKDSMGNTEVIRRGEVQYMCAGTGITHSEFNPSAHKKAHLLQIWIEPQEKNLTSSYGQKSFLAQFASKKLIKVLSKDGSDGSIKIHQNASLYIGWLNSQKLQLPIESSRYGWLQVVKGEVQLNDYNLKAGDAASFNELSFPEIEIKGDSEILFFDLA